MDQRPRPPLAASPAARPGCTGTGLSGSRPRSRHVGWPTGPASAGGGTLMPALLTRMSMSPSAAATSWCARVTSCASPTSASASIAEPPARSTCACVSASVSRARPVSASRQPAAAKASAIARPMPGAGAGDPDRPASQVLHQTTLPVAGSMTCMLFMSAFKVSASPGPRRRVGADAGRPRRSGRRRNGPASPCPSAPPRPR